MCAALLWAAIGAASAALACRSPAGPAVEIPAVDAPRATPARSRAVLVAVVEGSTTSKDTLWVLTLNQALDGDVQAVDLAGQAREEM